MPKRNIFIFIPNNLESERCGYVEGFYKEFDDCEVYYITNPIIKKQCTKYIGYSGNMNNLKDQVKTLYISNNSIKINGLTTKTSVVKVWYDYHSFKASRVVEDTSEVYGKLFHELKEYLKFGNTKNNGRRNIAVKVIDVIIFLINVFLLILSKFKIFVPFSATFYHLEGSLKTTNWFLSEVKGKKWSLTLGNVLFARIIDLILGIILMNYFLNHQSDIVDIIKLSTQELVEQLKTLLLYLMGSPIGLKLNYAFNKSLGTFFFYHISLWKVFLNGLHPILLDYFRYLVLPGMFGFTFQLAMLSDIISISTFHVYCIYVYAARLFHMQIKCLISLWRLFTGRKFNPLRNRIDTCQYEQNQLFIGTLGFTVFLFLLPTTTMYYTVFVIFRMVLKTIDTIFCQIRYFLSVLPLYAVLLWIFSSPLVAGSMYIKWVKVDQDQSVNLQARLKKLPLPEVLKLVPNFSTKKELLFGQLIHKIFTGVLT